MNSAKPASARGHPRGRAGFEPQVDEGSDAESIASDGQMILASVSLGGFAFLVSLRWVSHALRLDKTQWSLPRAEGALVGVALDRGRPLPLVDLRRWAELPSDPGEAQQASSADGRHPVLVLHDGPRRVGLILDAVKGFVSVRADARHRLFHGSAEDQFFDEVVISGEPAGPRPLLDVSRLLAVTGLWAQATTVEACPQATTVDACPQAQAAPPEVAASAALPDQIFFRCADRWFAVDCAHVSSVRRIGIHQAMSDLEPGVLGFVRLGEREIVLIDPLAACELDTQGLSDGDARRAGEPGLVVILAMQDALLGVAIDALGIVGGAQSVLQPLSALALRRPEDFLGLVRPCGRGSSTDVAAPVCLRLDVPALLARFRLSVLARVDDQRAADENAAQTTHWRINREAYLVFRAGQRWAAPVADFLALLPWQGETRLASPDARSVRGTLPWRDRVIALRDYAHAQGGAPLASDDPMVVLVAEDAGEGQQTTGWLVSGLERLIPAHTGRLSQLSVLGGKALSVITVGPVGQSLSFQVVRPLGSQARRDALGPLQRAV